MATPATALASILNTVVLCFGVLWVMALVVGRIYAFHEAYVSIRQKLANDAKLLELCADVEFVAMMQQHSDVCSNVQVAANVNPWLKALDTALTSPTLCGTEACVDVLAKLSIWSGWTGILSGIAVALCMPQLLRWFMRPRSVWPNDAKMDPTFKPLYYHPICKSGGV